jgi:hypothetical protein
VKAAAVALAVACCGCGYRVAGRADLLPKTVQTIAIPAFGNATTRYRLTEALPAAIGREFLRRTRYHVVADPAQADAVLEGAILNSFAYPVVSDPVSSRSTVVQLTIVLQVKLTERATGKPLFERQIESRQRYEISVDQVAYFEESGAALQRLAADVARTVVSAVLETF